MVTQEMTGHSSRVGEFPYLCAEAVTLANVKPHVSVVRNLSTGKVMATFGEVSRFGFLFSTCCLILYDKSSDLQAEKRGNFVVIGCVEGSRVISWSLNVS